MKTKGSTDTKPRAAWGSLPNTGDTVIVQTHHMDTAVRATFDSYYPHLLTEQGTVTKLIGVKCMVQFSNRELKLSRGILKIVERAKPLEIRGGFAVALEFVGYTSRRKRKSWVLRFHGSYIGEASSEQAAEDLSHAYNFQLPESVGQGWNPIVRESTAEGRTDGVRVFERKTGVEIIFDPSIVTMRQWVKVTGLPLPFFPPSPAI